MPHDVTMPQLGMAQDAGKIVAWLKVAGDPVAKGDALFEVETDKATMEVEAQANGFLTGITAQEGEDVPVGAVIARISDSAEDDNSPSSASASAFAPAPDHADDLPKGQPVTMPQLGMAQDSGLLVSWTKGLGDKVAADDILFEVETDKSTMEVPAGVDGYLAATLAEPGEDVPVGATLAIISTDTPAHTTARSANSTPAPSAAKAPPAPAATPPARAKEQPAPKPHHALTDTGRILASPKARRLALERGLDLHRLVAAGHPQPFHVRDLDVLANLPTKIPATATVTAAPIRLTAEIATDGFTAFADWAATSHGLTDRDAVLAGLAGASLSQPGIIAIERHGQSRGFAIPPDRALSAITRSEDGPDLILRDLRDTALRSVAAGAEGAPVLTVMSGHVGLIITLECSAEQMPTPAAIALLSAFAGRMEQPLRHLL
ncbi:MAG: biotin/lipoyl-containing protein [Paracoccaceae bacterium]|jgi:pyruvate dehydrogenase E2 component (dihydrolipoamide acetyltransferase)/2-oxoglutarate dehydrogenase E2 component (dihydrolipoamide succinyltransferase)|nr:biotin/lipoyl-containing protein [Paracoccaceae bacterium]